MFEIQRSKSPINDSDVIHQQSLEWKVVSKRDPAERRKSPACERELRATEIFTQAILLGGRKQLEFSIGATGRGAYRIIYTA
jgi:hypothetical protein